MRRELIIALICMICVSTLSSILSSLVVKMDASRVLLDTVVGSVGAGNFSYWQLGHTGPLLVELLSRAGDADLYVADNNRPSYEVDKNNYSSTTCGADVVAVPTDFPRPIGIAVFGHWTHAVSEYTIHVYLDGPRLAPAWPRPAAPVATEPEPPAEDAKPRILITFLALVDMVFDMFVV